MENGAATADTLIASSVAVANAPPSVMPSVSGAAPGSRMGATTFARTTVLPRRRSADDHPAGAPRYEPVRALGEGGMGEVLLVHDHDIGRKVAVKRLKADRDDEGAILRFAEEVRTVGHLEHPGIVPVHDVGIDEQGAHYLVMKYVEGDTLDTIIGKLAENDPVYRARYTHSVRVQVFRSLLQALRYAHTRGVIHRDLKPSNVMVGPFGEVMLMDWGIAKSIERGLADGPQSGLADTVDSKLGPQRLVQTAVGSLLGTPLYMSPEQAEGKVHELDERSDVYSACLVFLELLTLKHPYAHKRTTQELIIAQAKDELTPAQYRDLFTNDDAPMEYNWLLRKGLAKNRDERYASVAELEEALQSIADGRTAVQCHVTLAKRGALEFTRWVDRHPGAYTVIFATMVLGMIAAMVFGVVTLVRAVI